MTSDPGSPSFLLVEDDPLLSITMRRYLERWSKDVRHAETCEQAVAAWASMPPGLVLMDYRLPDGQGTDVVGRMRARGRTDPVICMTGEAETISPAIQRELGIRRVLAKPVMLDVLRAELDGLEKEGALRTGGRAPSAGPSRHSGGKFRNLRWHGGLTGRRVARLCKAAREELWVALDVTGAGDADADGWRGLCAWAGWLSSLGGRLCLVAQTPEQRHRMEQEVGEWVDVVTSMAMIEAQAGHLTGRAERRQLLDLIASSGRRVASDG